MIEEVRLDLLKLPLKEPYKLALGSVTHFDTILAHVAVDGREGIGEATILSGYADETVEDGWHRARALLPRLIGASSEAGKALSQIELADAPFTRTAFVSALEMCEGNPILEIDAEERVALLAGINATDRAGIEQEIETALARGYDTLKIKAGFDLEADLDRVAFIQRCNAGRAKLRIDANQGFDREDGVRFAARLSPDSVELLEQPCAADDWEAAAAVARVGNVSLMLDESIYDLEDIKRAAGLGAAFVKLKLMKMGGLDKLAEGLVLIRDLGMQPVLGNGVASDPGCWMEACVARRYVRNAGEMNGYLRQCEPLAANPIQVEAGKMQLPSGLRMALDEVRLAATRVSQAHAGGGQRTAQLLRMNRSQSGRNRENAMGQGRTQRFEVIPTGAALGADIVGADLSGEVDDEVFRRIYEAWNDHLVLRFRGQRLDDDALVAFSRRFGELDMAPIIAAEEHLPPTRPEIAVISNIVVGGKAVGSLGNSELVWHQDMSYTELPPKASLLYAIETPSAGGETFFYNLYKAYETMPRALKVRIQGLSCKHDATRNSAGQLRKGFGEHYCNAERPGAVHPLVVRHLETGRSSLYLGRRPNAWIVGLSDADSEALLDDLWGHVENGPHMWVQQWHQGDLVIWDNRCTLHRRNQLDPSLRRLMHRTQVRDKTRPVAACDPRVSRNVDEHP